MTHFQRNTDFSLHLATINGTLRYTNIPNFPLSTSQILCPRISIFTSIPGWCLVKLSRSFGVFHQKPRCVQRIQTKRTQKATAWSKDHLNSYFSMCKINVCYLYDSSWRLVLPKQTNKRLKQIKTTFTMGRFYIFLSSKMKCVNMEPEPDPSPPNTG